MQTYLFVESKSNRFGLIIGVAAGGVALIVIIVVGVVLFRRKRTSPHETVELLNL